MTDIIPKEELASYERWQARSFDRPKPTPGPQPAAPAVEVVDAGIGDLALPTAEDIERIHEEARTLGYQAGYEEGREAAEAAAHEAAAEQAQHFQALIGNLQAALGEIDQQVADQLLDLASEIAAQVVRGSLAVHRELLLPIIREAIAALPLHHGHLTLRLNPADAQHVRAQIGEQLAQSGAQIIDDGEVSPGGCQVRAGTSEVDATIETRWKRVLEAIGAEPKAWLTP